MIDPRYQFAGTLADARTYTGPPPIASLSAALRTVASMFPVGLNRRQIQFDAEPYNILIVGDGYHSSETAEFYKHCNQLVGTFTNPYPSTLPSWALGMLEYVRANEGVLIRDLTFYTHLQESVHSGVSAVRDRNTVYGTYYSPHPWIGERVSFSGQGNLSMLSGEELYARTNAVRRMMRIERNLLIHRVLILVNASDRAAGHTGGALLVPGGHKDAFKLFQHELGHALGLGDEYYVKDGPTALPHKPGEEEDSPLKRKDYPYPNVSWDPYGRTGPGPGDPGTKKTQEWPDPDDEETEDDLEKRTGAIYNPRAYRPAPTCAMGDAESEDFCKVCRQHFIDFFTLRAGRRVFPWQVNMPVFTGNDAKFQPEDASCRPSSSVTQASS